MASASGGAAGAGGHEYQAQTAAYYGVGMLCAPVFTVGWELPSGGTVEAVRCETEGQVDDVELLLSTNGVVQIQAKRSVGASRSEGSPLGKALRQFVDAFLEAQEQTRLTADHSRLVLATSGSASRAMSSRTLAS